MLPSGNDAAYCLAEYFGHLLHQRKYMGRENEVRSFKFNGTEVKFFLKQMNKYAFKLKMYNTYFDSPHGLMNRHNVSTA